MNIYEVLELFRSNSSTERNKGEKFEKLMLRWLLADPTYSNIFTKVWMWADSPCTESLGKADLGIDLVALDDKGGYWAIQCKCYDDKTVIQKAAVDSFLANSSREFVVDGEKIKFGGRMWISTTNKYGKNAEQTFEHQSPVVNRVSLQTLDESQVDWKALVEGKNGNEALREKATPRKHQEPIIEAALHHFKENERGTLVMACGTGKTLTSLFIAQQMLENKGMVLFLAPSIALVGQSLNSWFANSEKPIKAVCICSDSSAGTLFDGDTEEDYMRESLTDLPIRSCTNAKTVVEEVERYKNHDGLVVCFSTYQSIDVVHQAQQMLLEKNNNEFGSFDFIICDEAHRTAAVTINGKEDSDFTKIHNGEYIVAKHRMYMTATPKVYNDASKNLAVLNDDLLYSMDKEEYFGKQFYTLGFGTAVQEGLLTDYKVIVLTIDEAHANSDYLNAYKAFVDKENEGKDEAEKIHHITPEQQAMILGSVSALSKQLLFANQDDFAEDEDLEKPMHTAIAFCDNVRRYSKTKEGVYCATEVYRAFEDVTRVYKEVLGEDADSQDFVEGLVDVKANYVSGDMPSSERNQNLQILREQFEPEEKRSNVVCNVNCLSEGVDVPALDAAIFLAAKDSMITIVQSVGRVMRKFEGKKYGYIIVPVVIPIGQDANDELDKNTRFKKVWTILNAMRSHDERLAAELSSHNYRHVKVTVPRPPQRPNSGTGKGNGTGKNVYGGSGTIDIWTSIEFVDKLYARMVDRVGERFYWEKWSKKVGDVAQNFIARLNELIEKGKYVKEIDEFVKSLQKNLNPYVDRSQAITFLAQQLITKPVFDALFPDYQFTKNNTVSRSIQTVLDAIQDEAFVQDREVLRNFYDNVSQVCGTLTTIKDKQDTIKTLYDKFFKGAFPKTVEQLGIVYTPIECVDFIIQSVDDVLKKEFNTSLKDRGVNILDPFTGTGTFITQTLNYLYQHGISQEDLEYKYRNEIHCNEIVLLAYYIADVNIESVYNELSRRSNYLPYNNICLTDTFQLAESKQGVLKLEGYFKENSEQINKQKKLPIRVIIGNPPYSGGQKDGNDNAANLSYPEIEQRIMETYAKNATGGQLKGIYDSYIKAIRFASDRIQENEGGVIGFITNNKWLDGIGYDGFRNSIEKEFTDIYVLNLRGAIRGRSGDSAKKEGQNVFDIMTGVAIIVCVKNPQKRNPKATIHYKDIGDYLTKKEKFSKMQVFKSIVNDDIQKSIIVPSDSNDWISQRNTLFEDYPLVCSKVKGKEKDENTKVYFHLNSCGVVTNRDVWCYNFSNSNLKCNVKNTISFYNSEVDRLVIARKKGEVKNVLEFINYDKTKFSWDRAQKESTLPNCKKFQVDEKSFRTALYRPFCKQNIYFNRQLNNCVYKQPTLFPTEKHKNILICVNGLGGRNEETIFISNQITDLNMLHSGTQCLPLYWYESKDEYNKRKKKTDFNAKQLELFDVETDYESLGFDEYGYLRHDGITDYIYEEINARFGFKGKSKQISKEDIFYYVYGLLHSEEYRTTFEADLKKSLPHIPIVETATEFKAFMDAGRKLADLHLNYESVEPCMDVVVEMKREDYKVTKMKFASKTDKSQIIYNDSIIIKNIPAETYEYVVNGKSAIEWIMERYQITQDKDSLIVNDCNDWGKEHGNERYIFDLLLRVINVSVHTMEIVKGLPKLKFE